MLHRMNFTAVLLVLLLASANTACVLAEPEELPNILWITSEDNSAYYLGSYGNEFAIPRTWTDFPERGFSITKPMPPARCATRPGIPYSLVYMLHPTGMRIWQVTIRLPII